MKRNLKLYASVIPPPLRRGIARKIDEAMKDSLLDYIDLRTTVYFDGMCLYLLDDFGIAVSIYTVARMLKGRGGHTRKSVYLASLITPANP